MKNGVDFDANSVITALNDGVGVSIDELERVKKLNCKYGLGAVQSNSLPLCKYYNTEAIIDSRCSHTH